MMLSLSKMRKAASRVGAVPGLSWISPAAEARPSEETLAGYLECQRLAERGAREIGALLREGWTEKTAAALYETWLRDNGVKSFFHHPFAWFGERTRFDGVSRRKYWEFSPSDRVLLPGEVFILDAAPILHGYISDIGYTSALGVNADWEKAHAFLEDLRDGIPSLFSGSLNGGAAWDEVDRRIRQAGYDNIHQVYPFSVLGHRVHAKTSEHFGASVLNFGWQSFWGLASRGLFGQLLNRDFEGDLRGLWAVEPHIGGRGFGAKFEEILVVGDSGAYWLGDTEGSDA